MCCQTQNSGRSCTSDSRFKCCSSARLYSQNKIKTALRIRLMETKTQNLMTITSSSPALGSFDYEQEATLSPQRIKRRFNNDFHVICMSLSICTCSLLMLFKCCAPLFFASFIFRSQIKCRAHLQRK